MHRIRTALLHLAATDSGVRSAIVPLTRQANKWQNLPKGWTTESRQKFWDTLTGDNKHKVTKCIKEMKGKEGIDNPGAFCAALADRVLGPDWRKKKAGAIFKGASSQEVTAAVDRVALRHLLGFNKYNAPEVMAQLVKLLKDFDLDEPLDMLRRHKIPQAIDSAWKAREKR